MFAGLVSARCVSSEQQLSATCRNGSAAPWHVCTYNKLTPTGGGYWADMPKGFDTQQAAAIAAKRVAKKMNAILVESTDTI